MKSLFIPPLGTRLVLARDWTFLLYDNYRNDAMIRALKVAPVARLRDESVSFPARLPAGAELVVRNYRIRQGQHGTARVSFTAKVDGKAHRFWVSLADANKIDARDPADDGVDALKAAGLGSKYE